MQNQLKRQQLAGQMERLQESRSVPWRLSRKNQLEAVWRPSSKDLTERKELEASRLELNGRRRKSRKQAQEEEEDTSVENDAIEASDVPFRPGDRGR